MRRIMSRIGVAMMVAVLVVGAAWAQTGRRGGADGGGAHMRRGGRGAGDSAAQGMMQGELRLTSAERKAVEEAIKAKEEAQKPLREQMQKLATVMQKSNASDAEYKKVVADYLLVRDKVNRQVAEIDKKLMTRLSPESQAKLLAIGIVDNGFNGPGGGRGPGMGRGGGMRGGGGMGGRRGSRGAARGTIVR